MPSTKGYRSYHGRGGAGRIVLIVLLCLILLAAVGFLVLQRYAVYGSDGSIRFDLPWKQTEEPSDPSAPDGASRTPDAPDDSPDVIIDEPEPPAKPELTELHGAELSESVLRGNADAALAAVPEGANAVALRMKNARGELLYDSALQEAIDVNAVKGGSGANAVIAALTGSEVYTIARINATHDSLYSFAHMADAGVLQLNYAGYIWYDPDSTFYLAPEKAPRGSTSSPSRANARSLALTSCFLTSSAIPPAGGSTTSTNPRAHSPRAPRSRSSRRSFAAGRRHTASAFLCSSTRRPCSPAETRRRGRTSPRLPRSSTASMWKRRRSSFPRSPRLWSRMTPSWCQFSAKRPPRAAIC